MIHEWSFLDEDYISFLESLKNPVESDPFIRIVIYLVVFIKLMDWIAPPPLDEQPKSTPLLEALKAEKEAAAIKSRYHPAAIASAATPRHSEDPSIFSRKPQSSKTSASEEKKGKRAQGGKGSLPANATSTPPVSSPTKQSASGPARSRKRENSQADATDAPSENTKPERKRLIVGLANRQFEAALNAAGAGDASGSRPPKRRERGEKKQEDKSQPTVAGEDSTPVGAPSTSSAPTGATRGGRKAKTGGGGRGGASSAAPAKQITIQPKMILARPDPTPVTTSANAQLPDVQSPTQPTAAVGGSVGSEVARGRGGGSAPRAKGRGRGRGRGAAPGQAGGGGAG